jgi:uncharacterized protein YciI
MKNDSEKIRDLVPEHIKYWSENRPVNYSGGPFSDRSGGLILFNAESIEKATELAMNDPFIIQKLIETKWVKEWIRE